MRQSSPVVESRPLTIRQREVLAFIRSKPIPPTVREIVKHFGWHSINAVQCHLRALEQKGALKRERGTPRGITVQRARPVLPCRGIVR